ncbi:MAG: DUF3098 domain-containing protein [Alistipes sp.]|nr:DUF3098 domain-containing protein [Alistipes sp.]
MNKQLDNQPENPRMPLTRKNYIILAIGFAIVLLGFVLMAGGGNHSTTEFNYEIFSFRRITLAPILVVGGFVVEIYGILKRY